MRERAQTASDAQQEVIKRNIQADEERRALRMKVLELAIRAIPLPHLIREVDVEAEPDAIRFTWCSKRYRVSLSLSVETVEGRVLSTGGESMLMEALLKLKGIDIERQTNQIR